MNEVKKTKVKNFYIERKYLLRNILLFVTVKLNML